MALLDKNMESFYGKWQNSLPLVRGVDMPKSVIDRLNNLFVAAYDSKKVRRSKAYKIGKALLSPFKWIRSKS